MKTAGDLLMQRPGLEKSAVGVVRGLAQLPYGVGAWFADVVGSDQGGGYEWRAAPSATPLARGNTALELDDQGKITRLTAIYDS
jgi:hypothetical protein